MSEQKKDTKTKEESNSTPEKNSDNKLEKLEYSKKIGDYILFDQIGMGTFSKVSRAFHLITQQTVAVKILDKEKIEDEIDIERIIREIEILKNIHHPNIAQMYETYSTIHNFYLMLEYVSGGDLFDYITSNNFLSEKKSCYFFRQIISVLEYLIELGISHRDIKPENILLNEEYTQIKFIDFGLSNYCSQNELLHSSCGSPCYASPEMLSGRAYKGTTTDLWSAGIVLYSMLVGALPFDDQELHKLYDQIKVGKFYIPSTLSLEAIDLLKKILEVDPKKRISLEGVKNHPWFKLEENPLYKGINISIEHFPCDTKVVNYVIKNYFKDDKDISLSIFVKMVHSHECNKYTATYYLVKNNILGVEEKFKIRKEKRIIEDNQNKDNIDIKDNKENNIDNKDNKSNDKNDLGENEDKDKEKNKELNKDNKDTNLNLKKLINKKDEEFNTRNKNNDIKNNLESTEKNEDMLILTGNTEEDKKLRSKTEDDVNKCLNNTQEQNQKKSNEIKQNEKNSNEDDVFFLTDNGEKKQEDINNEENDLKSSLKNENCKNKNKPANNNNEVKKKSSNKDNKKSNKKNNIEIRTGKIAIPVLNIKKSDNGIKFDEKYHIEKPINNLKKSEQHKNYKQNKYNNININKLINSKNISNNNNKIQNKKMNQLIIKNSSKNNIKKNKTNSPKSTNNLNFYVINNIINKDKAYITERDIQNTHINLNLNKDANGNDIIPLFPKTHEKLNSTVNEKKKVFDKIRINFKSSRDYKYAKSPSDINLISKNFYSRHKNNSNNQLNYYKTSNNNDFNEAALFRNRIKFKNSSKNSKNKNQTYNNSNLIIRTSNNINNYDKYNNGINKNIILYDNNINNNGYISNINKKNNLSVNQYNSQNKKNDKNKKNINIFSNYINQKNIYNIFNNDYSKNQTHQRNFKSALKFQLTEFKTENRVINNNIFISKKKTVSRNKKSSYNKEYNNTNFMSKNKNNNIIKEYETKFILNMNQKHANSIDDSKKNFSSTPKYMDKNKNNSRDRKAFFANNNILNIDYLLKGKNKKNKLILTSTIGYGNNSPKKAYNIDQNYFGNAFHTEGNVKNNNTNKNKENLSVVLKKGIIRNQKKDNKDIFNLRFKEKAKNNSDQRNVVNNSNNIYSNIKNNGNKNNKGF